MRAKAIVAVAAVMLVAAAVSYHFSGHAPAAPASVAETIRELPSRTNTQRSAANPATQPSDSSAISADDKETRPQTVDLPGLEPVEFEIIDGIRVRKDRNCTLRIATYITRPDGTVLPSYICEPHELRPVDPYTTYSNEALKTLAYSDPHAAHLLSLRFREKDFSQAVNYALRSSVLADNTHSIRWLLNNYPDPTYRNEQVQIHVVEDNYVLSGVIYALGGPAEHLVRWSSIAQEHAKDGIDTEALDTRIADLMNTVETIRSEVGSE